MSEKDKLGLFREGVMAGYKFLEEFNWPQYKELRTAELAIQRIHRNIARK
jgi:hypothetical protein